MNKTILLTCCIIIGITSLSVQAADGPLVHSVFFKLKCEKGSEAEGAFYQAAMELADIPGVQKLKWFSEISPKNSFCFIRLFCAAAWSDGCIASQPNNRRRA